jgi:hypothetical protein
MEQSAAAEEGQRVAASRARREQITRDGARAHRAHV